MNPDEIAKELVSLRQHMILIHARVLAFEELLRIGNPNAYESRLPKDGSQLQSVQMAKCIAKAVAELTEFQELAQLAKRERGSQNGQG